MSVNAKTARTAHKANGENVNTRSRLVRLVEGVKRPFEIIRDCLLRGGRMTKVAGQVASYAPTLGTVVKPVLAGAVVAGGVFGASGAYAQQAWDGAGATNNGTIEGGAGTWDAATTNWTTDGGTTNVVYNAGPPAPEAVFGTAGGAVNVSGGQGITDLTFNVDGYILSGSQLAIHDNGSTVTVTNGGDTATIGNVLSDLGPGTGALTKAGAGALTLSGANTFTGKLTISGGQLTAAAVGSLGATTGDAEITAGVLDLGGLTHTKATGLITGGTLQNGVLNLTFAGQTGGMIAATVNAPMSVDAIGGTISSLGTTGIVATNATAAGISVIGNGMAPAINNAAGHGISLNNSNGGNVVVTLGNNVTGTGGDGINIVSTGGGTVTVDGTGNVTGGPAVGMDGIDITADGDTTVSVNGTIQGDPGIVISSGAGNILVNGAGDVVGAVQAMDLDTTTGSITVNRDASGGPQGILGGTIGIDANSTVSGAITIAGQGAIRGTANEGVLARTAGNGTILINHAGTIRGGTAGVDAATTGTGFVTVAAQQDVTGDTTAGIITRTTSGINTINGVGTITGVTFGIDAQSLTGDVTVSGTGTTTANAGSGIVVSTGGAGNILVNRSGAILGTGGSGIVASTGGTGTVTVTTGANVTGTGGDGINVVGTGGTITVSNNGNVSGSVDGIDIISTGGNVSVQGNGNVSGPGGTGIAVAAVAANVNVGDATTNGTVTGKTGISGSTNGAGTVTIGANNTVTGTVGRGIFAQTADGAISVSGTGAVTGNTDGIFANAIGAGNVNVTTAGAVNGTNGFGIVANSGTGNVLVTPGTVTGALAGIVAGTAGAGTVTVTTGGTVTGTGTVGIVTAATDNTTTVNVAHNVNGGTVGVDANGAGTGLIDINQTAGTITAGTIGIDADQTGTGNIDIDQTGGTINGTQQAVTANATTGSVNVLLAGTVGATTGDTVQTETTTGSNTVTANTAITSTGGTGIGANATGAGAITIDGTGAVTGVTGGINATSAGGAVSVTGASNVTSTGNGTTAINATTTGANVTVATGGPITGAGTGVNAVTDGAGVVQVTTGGAVEGTTETGIVTVSAAGNNTVTVGHNVTGGITGVGAITTGAGLVNVAVNVGTVMGTTGFGIDLSAGSNAGNVINIAGGATVAGATAIRAGSTAAGTVTATNAGTVTGTTNGFSANGGTVVFTNNNIFNGNIQSTGATTAFTVNNTATWNYLPVGSTSTLSGTADAVNNTGTLNVINGATVTGLETLINSGTMNLTGTTSFAGMTTAAINNGTINNNGTATFNAPAGFTHGATGIIDQRDGASDDVVNITGNFTANAGSVSRFDVNLQTGTADVINVSGTANGTTRVILDLLSLGANAPDAEIDSNGPIVVQNITNGLFFNRLNLIDGNGGTITPTGGNAGGPGTSDVIANSGIIQYLLQSDANGDLFITSQLNGPVAAAVPALASVLNAISATFHKPTSAFVTCISQKADDNPYSTWARGNVGKVDTKTSGLTGNGASVFAKMRTNYQGVQVGADAAYCNMGGKDENLHLGVTAGYINSSSTQRNLAGGLKAKTDTVFGGVYSAYSSGDFTADLAGRYDYHSLDVTDGLGIIPGKAKLDAHTFSGTATAQYTLDVNGLFDLSPSTGFALSSTKLDALPLTGGGSAKIKTQTSAIGFVGATATKQFSVSDSVIMAPFASITAYHEFVKKSKSTFTTGGTTTPVSTNRIGTWGQVGAGTAFAILSDQSAGAGFDALVGALRFDAQFGKRIDGWGITAQLRAQF